MGPTRRCLDKVCRDRRPIVAPVLRRELLRTCRCALRDRYAFDLLPQVGQLVGVAERARNHAYAVTPVAGQVVTAASTSARTPSRRPTSSAGMSYRSASSVAARKLTRQPA